MESYTPVDLLTAGMILVYKTLSRQRGINKRTERDPVGGLFPPLSFHSSPNIFRLIDSRVGNGDRKVSFDGVALVVDCGRLGESVLECSARTVWRELLVVSRVHCGSSHC